MERHQFFPGKLYVLTREVTNPSPDGRERYDWRKASDWTAGTRFRLREGYSGCWELSSGQYWHQSLALREPLDKFDRFTAPASLLDALDEVEPRDAREALWAAGVEDWLAEAVEILRQEGRFTFAELIEAANKAQA